MSPLKYALPALAVAGLASAQCPTDETFTIRNQGDAGRFQSCRTFRGNIEIDSGTTGTIALDGLQELQGDLTSDNTTELTGLTSSSLQTISGRWILTGNTILSNLNFPRLTEVDTISWETLPELRQLQFGSEVTTAKTVDIRDTQLQTLDGINLEEVDTFYIANNRFIREMELQLTNVSTSFVVEANGADLQVILPNLENAAELVFRNVSTVDTPSLQSVNGTMGFFGCGFESYAAPNLTEVGDLSFSDNENLNNITLPELTSCSGGFTISRNRNLDKINGIPKLESVDGALDFSGDFSDAELPALDNVQGAFNMQSTKDIQPSCDKFEPLSGNEIQGEYVCKANEGNPTDREGNSSSDQGASDEPDAAVSTRASMTIVVGLSGLVAVVLGFF